MRFEIFVWGVRKKRVEFFSFFLFGFFLRKRFGAKKKNSLLLPHLDPEVGLPDDVLLFRVELGSLF